MLLSNLSEEKYATRYKEIFYPPNPNEMSTFERTLEAQYVAAADGETVIILTELIGALRVIQVEKEIKPMFTINYSFNSIEGRVNLLGGVSLGKGQALFILYAKLVTI